MRPDFRRFAARFPLTRPLARKRQSELFDLVAGFVYSQILAASVRLRLPEAVAEAPATAADLAPRLGLSEAAAARLIEGAAALRLIEAREGGRYGLGDLGAALIGNPGVAAMVEHHALLYRDLADPVALLRDEIGMPALAAYWGYVRHAEAMSLPPEAVADYSRLMAVSQAFIAGEILDAFPLGRHRHLLDVGGGEGAFIAAAAARAPHLSFTLFDLPAVAARAAARFEEGGLAGRARAIGGDLFADALPAGADIATLIRVLYDHDRDRGVAILRSIRAALPPGGTLLVSEPMAGTRGAERMGAAYFGFYLLAMRGGNARSAAEIKAMIAEAGFTGARSLRTSSPLLTSLIVARA